MTVRNRTTDPEAAIPNAIKEQKDKLYRFMSSIAKTVEPIVKAQVDQVKALLDNYLLKTDAANTYSVLGHKHAASDITSGGTTGAGFTVGGNLATNGNLTVNGDVSTTGQVAAAGPVSGTQAVFPTGVRSTGAYGNQVTTSYRAAYLDSAGNLGYAPSTLASKNLAGNYNVDMAKFLAIQLYQYTYKSDPNKEMRMGPIADYLHAAGLDEFVNFNVDGSVAGIKFDMLIFGLWSAYTQSRTSTLARIAKQAHQTVTVASMSALSLGGTAQFKIVWPAAFADNDYLVTASVYSTAGLPVTGATAAVIQSTKTATGCTVQVNAGIAIAAGQTLTVEAIHV